MVAGEVASQAGPVAGAQQDHAPLGCPGNSTAWSPLFFQPLPGGDSGGGLEWPPRALRSSLLLTHAA